MNGYRNHDEKEKRKEENENDAKRVKKPEKFEILKTLTRDVPRWGRVGGTTTDKVKGSNTDPPES